MKVHDTVGPQDMFFSSYLYDVANCAYCCKVLIGSSRRVIVVEGGGLKDKYNDEDKVKI